MSLDEFEKSSKEFWEVWRSFSLLKTNCWKKENKSRDMMVPKNEFRHHNKYYDISDIYPELNSSKKFLHKCLHNINIDYLEHTAYN